MTQPNVLADIKKEFQQKLGGSTYRASLPKEKNWRAARR
jgi:hypothetical protein